MHFDFHDTLYITILILDAESPARMAFKGAKPRARSNERRRRLYVLYGQLSGRVSQSTLSLLFFYESNLFWI